jgi:hypothetical protein
MSQGSNDAARDWNHSIGAFITSFAYVELLVYELFEILPQDTVSKSHANLRDYSERARLLQALIRSTDWHERKVVEQLIEKSLPLATLRNQLAHNPLFIDLYTDGKEIVAKTRIVHAQKRKSMDHITLEQLHEKLSELSELASELGFQVGFLKGTGK